MKTEWNSLKKLNITRLFRRYITYLKIKEENEKDYNKPLNICILGGGGGNVAEAIAAYFLKKNHKVIQFRFNH